MNQTPFEVPFAANQQTGYGFSEQDTTNMGGVNTVHLGQIQPTLMAPGGNAGNLVPPGAQMMVLPTMMPTQQQPPLNMEQPQDTRQQPGAWGGCATMSPPQQGAHEQQAPPPPQQQSAAQARTPTHGNRAFKIFNPRTNEEVKGKDNCIISQGEGPVNLGA